MLCELCCHSVYSGREACGRTSRGHTGGRSHRNSPPSFCGACLNFSREKDSAVPFPRRPRSRILSTNELIILHKIPVRVTAPRFELTSQRQKVLRLPTEPPARGDRCTYTCFLRPKIFSEQSEPLSRSGNQLLVAITKSTTLPSKRHAGIRSTYPQSFLINCEQQLQTTTITRYAKITGTVLYWEVVLFTVDRSLMVVEL